MHSLFSKKHLPTKRTVYAHNIKMTTTTFNTESTQANDDEHKQTHEVFWHPEQWCSNYGILLGRWLAKIFLEWITVQWYGLS